VWFYVTSKCLTYREKELKMADILLHALTDPGWWVTGIALQQLGRRSFETDE
jgi:hypothetical protein